MKPIVELFRLESSIQQLKAKGQYELALQYFDQIIQIKQNLPNRLGLARTVVEKAYLLEQLGFRQDALQNYQYAWQLAENTIHTDLLQNIADRIGMLGR